jgi:hypothetical protein
VKGVLEKEFLVRYSEVDFRGWLHPLTILNYLQDAAAARATFERLNQAQKEKSKGESQVSDPGSAGSSTSD